MFRVPSNAQMDRSFFVSHDFGAMDLHHVGLQIIPKDIFMNFTSMIVSLQNN